LPDNVPFLAAVTALLPARMLGKLSLNPETAGSARFFCKIKRSWSLQAPDGQGPEATLISLGDARTGYKDLGHGGAKKFVLDTHGMVRKAAARATSVF
jgi:predicted Rdx family selenoprotein